MPRRDARSSRMAARRSMRAVVAAERKYVRSLSIGFATIPPTDEGGLSIAAVNRMIAGAVRGVKARAAKPAGPAAALAGSGGGWL